MTIDLQAMTTADLYGLIASTLNTLVDRDEEVTFGSDGIGMRFADIAETDGDYYSVVYFAEGCAELAAQETGGA